MPEDDTHGVKITPDQVAGMQELWQRGSSCSVIAGLMGCSVSSVKHHLVTTGVDLGKRGAKKVVTAEHGKAAVELRAGGATWPQCSRQLGFSIRALQRAAKGLQ